MSTFTTPAGSPASATLQAVASLKENLHTHTTWCDGKNTVDEMVQSAISAGFDVLGFSGHSYTSFDESYCMSPIDTAKYIAQVCQAALAYGDRITIFCGIEQDYYADEPPTSYDYVIGSLHSFFKPCHVIGSLPAGLIPARLDGKEGCYIYADLERKTLEWAIKHIYDGDALSLAEDYFETLSHLYEKTGCHIVGHFDLLTKFNEQPGAPLLFDTAAPRYQAAVDKALAALLPTGVIFEVNTGAMAKGYRTTPYPSSEILRKIQARGGAITISSDCHAAGKLDFGFREATALAKACGFNATTLLTREGSWATQPL